MDIIVDIIVTAILLGIYFAPTLIAIGRRHRNTAPILVVNLVLGLTLLGWVLSLAWSLSDNVRREQESSK